MGFFDHELERIIIRGRGFALHSCKPLTLGLPFIRTSPDHGTAFDKAGGWIADSRNFLEAAALAARLARRSGLDLPPSFGA